MAAPIVSFNREWIRPGDRVCVAVSGGADSVALLLMLHAANRLPRNGLGVGLSAVHVHHGLRGEEADGDLAFVEELCARLEVPLHVRHARVAARVAESRAGGMEGGETEPGGSSMRRVETIEEAARTLRYGFFRELLAEGAADSVLTAHTLDDQAETVLMKLLRGAWTEGLSGIYPVVEAQDLPASHLKLGRETAVAGQNLVSGLVSRGRIVRPLLGVPRAALRAYLGSRGEGWREDSSNSNEAFTRNRIRHAVLPVLREENPAIDEALANLAVLAREDEARWQTELRRLLPQMLLPGKPVRGGGRAVSTMVGNASVAIDLERLRGLDPAARRRVLRAAARRLGGRLTFDETAWLLELAGLSGETGEPRGGVGSGPGVAAAGGGRVRSKLHLAGGLRAERSARELCLYRAEGVEGPEAKGG